MVESARAAWPEVSVPTERFLHHVAGKLDGRAALATLRADGLYLACGCADGDAAALAAFDKAYAGEVDMVFGKLRLAPAAAGDVKQLVYQKLFVAQDGTPAIASYSGRGELEAWVRVVVTRTALNFLRGQKRDVPLDDAMLMAFASPADDPALELMKRTYRADFKAAFHEAVEALPSRQKNVLRFHFVDGLSLERIGALHQVHRTTASRWLADAQEALLAHTRRALTARLRISADELESVMRLIQSQISVNLDSLLQDASSRG